MMKLKKKMELEILCLRRQGRVGENFFVEKKWGVSATSSNIKEKSKTFK